jgi:uncharacterized protein (DUF58 family)
MRMVMHSFQAPRWVAPLLVLIAVALIPFALILALALAGLALGVSALRFFLSGAAPVDSGPVLRRDSSSQRISDSSVIDADFEVKNESDKGNGP